MQAAAQRQVVDEGPKADALHHAAHAQASRRQPTTFAAALGPARAATVRAALALARAATIRAGLGPAFTLPPPCGRQVGHRNSWSSSTRRVWQPVQRNVYVWPSGTSWASQKSICTASTSNSSSSQAPQGVSTTSPRP